MMRCEVPIHLEAAMTPTNPAQQAARAAAAEQMAAKAAMQATAHQRHALAPRKYPAHNTFIVVGVILAALGTFIALILRAG